MTPEEVVAAVYAAAFEGDVEGALALCHEDGAWHPVVGSGRLGPGFERWGAGSQPLRTYFGEILPAAGELMEGYAVLSVERSAIDNLVVSRVRSTHGAGVLVFRVLEGKLADVYVVSAGGRDVLDPF